jgi:hypothetical protein
MNEPIEYTIETNAGTIELKVTSKEVSESTKGYIRLCHEAISGVAEGDAGPRHIPLRERLVKLFAVWADTRAQFSRVLPSLYRVAPLNEQASKIVERLLSVQRSQETLQNVNQSQYRQLQATVDALRDADNKITALMGVDSRVDGTLETRVRVMGQNLVTALEANKAWAAEKTMLPCSERAATATQLESLRRENNAFRELHANQKNTIARYQADLQHLQVQLDSALGSRELYRTSVNEAHKVLDFAGAAKRGCVAERIKTLLKK